MRAGAKEAAHLSGSLIECESHELMRGSKLDETSTRKDPIPSNELSLGPVPPVDDSALTITQTTRPVDREEIMGMVGPRPTPHPADRAPTKTDRTPNGRILSQGDRKLAIAAFEHPSDEVFASLLPRIPLPFSRAVARSLRDHLVSVTGALRLDPLFTPGLGISPKPDEGTVRRLVRLATLYHDWDKVQGEHDRTLSERSGVEGALDEIATYLARLDVKFPEQHRALVRWLILNHDLFGEYFQERLFDRSWAQRIRSAELTTGGFGLHMNLSDALRAAECIFRADASQYVTLERRLASGDLDTQDAFMRIWHHFFYGQAPREPRATFTIAGEEVTVPLIDVPRDLVHVTSNVEGLRESGLLPSDSAMYAVFASSPSQSGFVYNGSVIIQIDPGPVRKALDVAGAEPSLARIRKRLGSSDQSVVLGAIAQASGAEIIRTTRYAYAFVSGRGLPAVSDAMLKLNATEVRSPLMRLGLLRSIHPDDAHFARALEMEGVGGGGALGTNLEALARSVTASMDAGQWRSTATELFAASYETSGFLTGLQRQVLSAVLGLPDRSDGGFALDDLIAAEQRGRAREGLMIGLAESPKHGVALSTKNQEFLRRLILDGSVRSALAGGDAAHRAQMLHRIIRNSMSSATLEDARSWAHLVLYDEEGKAFDRDLHVGESTGRHSLRLEALLAIPLRSLPSESTVREVVSDYLAPLRAEPPSQKVMRSFIALLGYDLRSRRDRGDAVSSSLREQRELVLRQLEADTVTLPVELQDSVRDLRAELKMSTA
jgi:hypothetical protein